MSSYGMSVTTLEEVFLKVANDATDHKNLGHLGHLRRESSASVVDASQGAGKEQVSRLSRRGYSTGCKWSRVASTIIVLASVHCDVL